MSDVSELQKLLATLAQPESFQLDDSTPDALLGFLAEYLAHVPYGEGADAVLDAWSQIYWMGRSPGELAQLADQPAQANGSLWPQQALLLGLLRMLQTPRALLNHLPYAHRELYYRQLLGLSELPAQPPSVVLSFDLVPRRTELLLPAGTLFSAGQDDRGTPVQFALDQDVLANAGHWTDLRWCRRSRSGQSASSRVVFDELGKRPWPEGGLRLFDPHADEQPLSAGWLLSLNGLQLAPGSKATILLQFKSDVRREWVAAASVSGAKGWIPLVDTSTPGLIRQMSFELPAGAGTLAAPAGLDGISLTQPVLQLKAAAEQVLPSVLSVIVNGQQVGYDDHPLTPFGFGPVPEVLAEDQLYLGFAGMTPGQSVALYLELQGARALHARWEYLNHANRWASLDASVTDGTDGLFRSGLWRAVLPADASDCATAMPAGRHWLRVRLDGEPAASAAQASDYPWLRGLAANAMTATLQAADALDDRVFERPLPADSIRQPVEPVPGLLRAVQPWASRGGRPRETSAAFLQRAALRLSHRRRALAWRDMVAILKADFSEVFEVTYPAAARQMTPPAQTPQRLVVIPVNRERDNTDALRPVLNAARLEAMSAHLKRLASPWQDIVVVNPRYRDVEVTLEVRFQAGVNPGYGYRQIQRALTGRYMPWSEDTTAGATPANRIDYYELMAHVQAQDGVDCVLNLALDGARASVQGQDDEVLVLVWPQFADAVGEE